jgi:hypothetical protein
MIIKFLLVCEGSSDRGLVPHLEALCVRSGALEAMGEAPELERLPRPPGRILEEKVNAALRLAGDVNTLFVHVDADARTNKQLEQLRQDIADRLAAIKECPRHVCVIPRQELESWLLADEDSIRAVVGNSRSKHSLGLPPPGKIEETAKAKERLEAALIKASGEAGRRLQRVKERFPEFRAMLLQRLSIDGPVSRLSAWQRLVADIETVVRALSHTRE